MLQLTLYGLVVSGPPIVVHVPAPAGEYWNVALATPDPGLASAESDDTVTLPVTDAPFAGLVRLPVGAVASRLIVTELEAVLPALSVAEQVSTVPVVFVVMLVGPQPVDEAIPAESVGAGHVTPTTSLVYQPFAPRVPVTAGGPTVGAVLSTSTEITGEVKVSPALSVVITRRSYDPSLRDVVFHVTA